EYQGSLIAQADYDISGTDTAEVGMIVADAYQHRGLGTALLKRLAQAATDSDIRAFEVTVRAESYTIMYYIRELGFPIRPSILPGKIRVVFPTSVTHAALEAFEQRDAKTTTAAVGRFFRPRSVAVIGASREKGSIGGELFRNLIEADFSGPVYP